MLAPNMNQKRARHAHQRAEHEVIGVEKIKIYENGTTLVESLNKDDSGMSKKNATSYANTIYFDGETGTRYRVEVSVFAEDAGGDSDSRSKTVTLTAK